MSLLFCGPGGSFETRWLSYALLRDNVQHHLEGGLRSELFSSLHAVEGALGGTSVRLSAVSLRAEALTATALLTLPRAALAISQRTIAVLEGRWPPPGDETVLVDEAAPAPLDVGDAATLEDVLGPTLASLLEVTDGAMDGSLVDVLDL